MRPFWSTRAAALIFAPCLLALGLGISYAGSSEIAKPVQGGVTIFAVPIQASADVNRDGIVNHLDLVDITRKLDTHIVGRAREDINHDRSIDVLDLSIVARYLGQEVQL